VRQDGYLSAAREPYFRCRNTVTPNASQEPESAQAEPKHSGEVKSFFGRVLLYYICLGGVGHCT
jgi:hypothetical protein